MFGGSAVRSPPCHLCHYRCVLGQDTSPTLPCVNVSGCCMFEVVVREATGTKWHECPGTAVATIIVYHTDCVWIPGTLSEHFECLEKHHANPILLYPYHYFISPSKTSSALSPMQYIRVFIWLARNDFSRSLVILKCSNHPIHLFHWCGFEKSKRWICRGPLRLLLFTLLCQLLSSLRHAY